MRRVLPSARCDDELSSGVMEVGGRVMFDGETLAAAGRSMGMANATADEEIAPKHARPTTTLRFMDDLRASHLPTFHLARRV
jgi:hypothetical protein